MARKFENELIFLHEHLEDGVYIGLYDNMTFEKKAVFFIDYKDLENLKQWFYDNDDNNKDKAITIHIPRRCSCSPEIFIELKKDNENIIVDYKVIDKESKEEEYYIKKDKFEKIFKEKYDYGDFENEFN